MPPPVIRLESRVVLALQFVILVPCWLITILLGFALMPFEALLMLVDKLLLGRLDIESIVKGYPIMWKRAKWFKRTKLDLRTLRRK